MLAYRRFADVLRADAPAWLDLTKPVTVLFQFATKKTAIHGESHRQTPDLDNLLKAFLDALLPDGDEKVWCVSVRKVWGPVDGVFVSHD